MKKLSIVIPLYKSAPNIQSLCDSLRHLCSELEKWDIEIVFVQDGCPENSIELAEREVFPKGTSVKFLKLSRNFGQQNAFLAGLKYATGTHFVSMSADLQDNPILIKEMIILSENGSEIVICNRTKRNDGLLNNSMSFIAYKFLKHEVSKIPQGGFDFFLLGVKSREALLVLRSRYRYLQSDILTLGFSVSYLPYERQRRLHGKSSYSFDKKLRIFANALLDSSYGLVNMITAVGFLISITGFLFGSTVVVGYFVGNSPFPGFMPILSAILFLNGFVLFALGIIAQYIWRIYDMARNRHDYIVEGITEKLF
jgi:dolichol-phosphate mannosyltransferase